MYIILQLQIGKPAVVVNINLLDVHRVILHQVVVDVVVVILKHIPRIEALLAVAQGVVVVVVLGHHDGRVGIVYLI